MTYVLNKALKRKKYSEPDLFAPGETLQMRVFFKMIAKKKGCEKCKEIRDNCEMCTKNEAYEMLDNRNDRRTFYRILQTCRSWSFKDQISYIQRRRREKLADQFRALTQTLYIFFALARKCLAGKEKVFHCDPAEKNEIIQNVLNDKLFGFFEVDIEVPEQKRKRFSEFCPLFVISEVPEDQIPQHMKDYKINTGRKMIKNNKKLLGVMKTEKILIYSPLLKWYLNHGLQVTKNSQIYILYIRQTFQMVSRRSFKCKKRS